MFIEWLGDTLAKSTVAALLLAGAGWLFKQQISAWLGKDLERLKSAHTHELEAKKAEYQRALEQAKSVLTREQEMLIRRRAIYAQLARTLRVFLNSPDRDATALTVMKTEFLAAYDEAALWASEEVVEAVSALLDFNSEHLHRPADQQEYQRRYVQCITAMRQDSGFPLTAYRHRPMVFT